MSTTTAATLVRGEELARRGEARAAIELMTAANRAAPDPALDAALVQLRYDAWPEVAAQPPLGAPAPPAAMPVTSDDAMPEVAAADLDAGTVRAAIEARGGLIVRGLLSPEWCDRLRDAIDRSWAAIRRYQQTGDLDAAWFHPIDTDAHGLTMAARQWGLKGGTSFVPDSPRLLFELLEAFDTAARGDRDPRLLRRAAGAVAHEGRGPPSPADGEGRVAPGRRRVRRRGADAELLGAGLTLR